MISIELQCVGSYEDDQLKVLKLVFCVFINLNLESHIKSINLARFQVLVCIVSTMANSLIAMVNALQGSYACT